MAMPKLRLPPIRLTRLQTILAVAVALMLIGDLVLLMGYAWAADKSESTQRQVAAVEQSMTRLRRPEEVESLKQQYAKAEDELNTTPNAFPKDVDTLALNTLITNSARLTGVDIAKVETGSQSVEHFGSGDYRAYKFTVTARGQLNQMILFLNKLETSNFTTLIISGQAYTLQNNGWNVIIELTAYAQKG